MGRNRLTARLLIKDVLNIHSTRQDEKGEGKSEVPGFALRGRGEALGIPGALWGWDARKAPKP